MAGCIVWRCQTCSRNASERFCDHPAAAYSIVYYVSGKPKWKKVSRDKKDALVVLSKINSDLLMGTYFDIKPIRFKELAERFLTTYGQVAYKPASREYYRFRVKALLPTFGELYLTDITREKMGQYAADQLTQEKVSPATINKNIGTLKRVLNLAVEWGYLPKNPAQRV